jgi:hypothetical protein
MKKQGEGHSWRALIFSQKNKIASIPLAGMGDSINLKLGMDMKKSKFIVLLPVFFLIVLTGCGETQEEFEVRVEHEKYKMLMDDNFDMDEQAMVADGMFFYAQDHGVALGESVTIERLAEMAYIEPAFGKSPFKGYTTSVTGSGDVLIHNNNGSVL